MAAIKAGDIGVSYDATFVFAEVNADRVYWMETPDGDFKVYKIMENMYVFKSPNFTFVFVLKVERCD